MPTLREIHRDLRSDSVLLLWALLFIEAPRTRRNFWRYQAYLIAGGLFGAWELYGHRSVWQGFLIGYALLRGLGWIGQYTPFAKPELLK